MIQRLTQAAAKTILISNDAHAVMLGAIVEGCDPDQGAELVEKYAIDAGHDGIRAHYASPVRKGHPKSYGVDFKYADEDGTLHTSVLTLKGTNAYRVAAYGVDIIAVVEPWDMGGKNYLNICAYLLA